jgi:hypothetical protein
MAMRETVGSLRAYFIIAGSLSALGAINSFNHVRDLGELLDGNLSFMLWINIAAALAFGIGFVLAGVQLKSALATRATWIETMLFAMIGMLALQTASLLFLSDFAPGTAVMLPLALRLAVDLYLLRSVRRLAAEVLAAQGLPPAQAL